MTCIILQAFNKALLMTTASSWAYVYDMSPPVAGHVYDGNPGTLPSHVKDIDYQTDMSSLSVYWEGFYDAHTVIKHYSVHVGTCSGCTDVMKQQYIGIHKGTNLFINIEIHFYEKVRVSEIQKGNHEWTIERHRQHWEEDRE